MGLGGWRGRPSWGQAPALHVCVSALDCRWCRRLVPGCFHPHPRIGVRGMPSITGMTMGQREPHERIRMVGAPGRATFANERSVLSWGQAPALQAPLPTPLDSGFRRNDELKGRNDEGMPRMTNERQLERSIPDRSPGHAFIAIAHAGWRRHTKV